MAYILKAKTSTIINSDDIKVTKCYDKFMAEGNHKKVYVIEYNEMNGKFKCNCEAYKYGKGLACKHIVAVCKKFVHNLKLEMVN